MARRITQGELTGLNAKEANFVIEYCKDFSARRAAEASGYAADSGYTLKERFDIATAIERVLESRLAASHIDAEWVLMEAVDNHMIARQQGKITASNTALGIIARHKFVDAMSAEKIEVVDDKQIMERLLRGRKRAAEKGASDDDVSFF